MYAKANTAKTITKITSTSIVFGVGYGSKCEVRII